MLNEARLSSWASRIIAGRIPNMCQDEERFATVQAVVVLVLVGSGGVPKWQGHFGAVCGDNDSERRGLIRLRFEINTRPKLYRLRGRKSHRETADHDKETTIYIYAFIIKEEENPRSRRSMAAAAAGGIARHGGDI